MPAIKDLLSSTHVQIIESAPGWEPAIRMALQPLIDEGFVERRYADAIITNTIKLGPYYVLCPEVALLHARPEDGVLQSQMAVTLLRKPILFKAEGPEVHLLITLAATNSDSHLEALRQLSHLLGDSGNVEAMVSAATPEELYGFFEQA